MAEYKLIRVKVKREFDENEQLDWGNKYLGVFGEDDSHTIFFDDADVVTTDDVLSEDSVIVGNEYNWWSNEPNLYDEILRGNVDGGDVDAE